VEHQADDTDRKQQCGTLCWLHALINGRSGGKDGISLVSWERHVTDVPLATGCTLLHREICQTRFTLSEVMPVLERQDYTDAKSTAQVKTLL